MELILQYKKFFEICRHDVNSLLYFWPSESFRIYKLSGVEYASTWCQEALDFAYRVIKINFMVVDYPDADPTDEEMNDIFEQMANNSPNIMDGLVPWTSYQLYLMEKGRNFIDAWLASGDDRLYGQKLIDIFNAHNVGFDKQAFYPVKY
ncbi:MAG: hypothetical protein LKI99_03220 [Acetobacter fabarum]|nr:hypothetical protein [Acetobacter fabarum]MCI1908715.1 hypothetical protein [Acetobacter fabarum]MCI1927560.1 hypothetical protein [Acetobacter fabarum]MCI1947575.1 hypothetical protein [Acetobacter fabarum]MCI1988799.1 hypothetical protein [Acetobacter fabarum]